jgi:hypothetical protein
MLNASEYEAVAAYEDDIAVSASEAVAAYEALVAAGITPSIPLKFAIATPVEGVAKYISALFSSTA